jgi:quercetin dioxygenase-like cupin family protein
MKYEIEKKLNIRFIKPIIEMSEIPFLKIDWTQIDKVEYKGETGTAVWQTIQFDGLRVRVVEYSSGYLADHWCQKGHIVHCLDGEFVSELSTGEKIRLMKGESCVVSDGLSSHRSITENGVRLLIIDGDFLK